MQKMNKEKIKKNLIGMGILSICIPYLFILGMGYLSVNYPILYQYNFVIAIIALSIFLILLIPCIRLLKVVNKKQVNNKAEDTGAKINDDVFNIKTWSRKFAICVLVTCVSLVMFSTLGDSAKASTSTATVTSNNGHLRVKANAAGQGYQIEAYNGGAYLKQYFGAEINTAEDSTNSNGSVVYFTYNGHQYLAGNKYYFSALSETAIKTTNMFEFVDNTINGKSITTTYRCYMPIYGGGGTLQVNLQQILTVTDTYVKKDFNVGFNVNVTDMRLIHGGDTFFGGKDAGFPSYNPLNNSVYIVPLLSGTDKDLNAGIMQFSGDTETPADHYFAGSYSEGRNAMMNGRLTDKSIPITSTSAVDGGYYLEWDRGNGTSMTVKSTERFIAESGAVQILAPSPINAIYGSEYAADFTAFNIGTSAITVSLRATSPAATTKIFDGNLEISQITLQPNESKNFTVKGIAGQTQVSGVLQVVGTYAYGGSSQTYTAKTDYSTKDGPAIKSVAITTHLKDTIGYTVETNKTGIAVSVGLRDNVTGTMVSGWTDSFTPTSLLTPRTASVSGLIPGRTYNLNVYISGNLTPNTSATFIHYSDAPPVGLGSIPASGTAFNNGHITGVSTDMEYRKSGDSTYTRVPGSTISSLTAGDYYVRYRNTTGEVNGWHLTSTDVKVTVFDRTYTVSQGTVSNGTWSGSSSIAIKDKMSGTLTFTPTSGYELLPANVSFTGVGSISVNNSTNTITLSNVTGGGVVNISCTQTQDTKDTILIDAELAKLKSSLTLDPLQGVNTDLNTKIFEAGKSKEPTIAYTFKNTAYTTANLVSSLNNTATNQNVSLEVTLTKGNIAKKKTIVITFPKENVVPTITSIKAKVKNSSDLSVILNNLTFGNFFNKEIEVTIDAQDANSGIKNISYQVMSTNDPNGATPGVNWITIADNPAVFFIEPSFKGVIFTKTEDKAGNISLNSYSKKGAVITENVVPTLTYQSPLTTTENNIFFNSSQNISAIINDAGISSNLNKTSYRIYKKDGTAWNEMVAKSKNDIYLFNDNKNSITYHDVLNTSGRYKVVVTGEDFSGNVNMPSDGYINVDVDRPTLAFTSAAPNTWVNHHAITLDIADGSEKVNSGLFTVSVIRDGGSPVVLKTYEENIYQDQPYTYQVDTDGTHTYQFQVIDRAGNITTSSSYTVSFDKTEPAFPQITKDIENGETVDGKTWYKAVKPNIVVTPTPSEVDRSLNTSSYRFNGANKVEINTTMNLTSQLQEGMNTIEVYAQDSAGNIAKNHTDDFVKKTLYVDTVTPLVESIKTSKVNDDMTSKILSALTFGVFYKETTKVTIKASDETSGINAIAYEKYLTEIENDSHVTSSWTIVPVDENNSISFLIDPSFKGNIYTKAIDHAGNESEVSKRKQASLVVEDIAPTITVMSSNTSEMETTSYVKGKQNVELSIEDTGTSSWLKTTQIDVFKWDGTQYQKESGLSRKTDYAVSDKKTDIAETIALTQSGRYRFNISAEDQAGNLTSEKIAFINIDVDKPTIAFTSTAPSNWVNQHTIKMDLKDQDSGLKTLYLEIDNGGKTPIQIFETNAIDYEYNVITPGEHSYQFTIVDATGNEVSSSSYVVRLDKTSLLFPKINRNLENGNQVDGVRWYRKQKPVISVTPTVQATDRAKRFSVVTINGSQVFETSDVSDINISQHLKEGKNTIRVSTYDEAGNQAMEGPNAYHDEVIYVDTASAKIDAMKVDGEIIQNKHITYRNRDSNIQVLASDQTSNVDRVAYALCKGLDATPKQSDWKEAITKPDGSISLTMKEAGNYTLYAKAYDKAGNEAGEIQMMNIVIDKTKPVIQNIENGKTYYVDQVFKVIDDNILNVKMNSRELNDYRVVANQTDAQTLILTVTDKASNIEEYQIYTKPIVSLMAPIANLTLSNVTKVNQKDLLTIKNELLGIDQTYASSEQAQVIASSLKRVNDLLAKIEEIQQGIKDITSKTPSKPIKKIAAKDEKTLLENMSHIDVLLNGNNLDDAERKQLMEEKAKLQSMYDHISSLKSLSEQKAVFDKQNNVDKKAFVQFEKDIMKTMNIKTKVSNKANEAIQVKYLLTALSPEDILNYEGQDIEIILVAKETKASSDTVFEGYEKVKSFDFTVLKKVDEQTEAVETLAQPIVIEISIKKDKDVKYVVVRHHDGKKKVLTDVTPKENQVSIKSSLFSTYELLKSEDNKENFNIISWLLVGIVLSGIGFFVYKRKKNTE